MPRRLGKRDVRASDADRARALAWVDAMAAQGLVVGDEEREARKSKIRSALYAHEIHEALKGLPDQAAARDPLASDGDREDAVRRIRMSESLGHLTAAEASSRVQVAQTSRTVGSLSALLADLPDLERPSTERRISDADRDDARRQLDEALEMGRIDRHEHATAYAQVHQARTRSELNAAFRGLSNPAMGTVRRRAAEVGHSAADVGRLAATTSGRVVAEGGRRIVGFILRLAAAVLAMLAAIAAFVFGPGWLGAVLLVVGLMLLVAAWARLFRSRRHR